MNEEDPEEKDSDEDEKDVLNLEGKNPLAEEESIKEDDSGGD
jgi:hypothetical protein